MPAPRQSMVSLSHAFGRGGFVAVKIARRIEPISEQLAASVILTQLYLSGAISFASVVAGLCTGAGAGLLVLFKMNKDRKENLKVLGLLYVIAVIAGIVLELFA